MIKIELKTGSLVLDIEKADYPLEELLGFAARNNSKRGFLFLSKVLGKHWPVKPSTMQNIHKELARRLNDKNLETAPYVIGMAETATALGRGIFEEYCSLSSLNAVYSHTTRYKLEEENVINFSEEHSHAVDQWLHLPSSPKAKNVMNNARHLVLVDDEMTTGKTFKNLIKSLQPLMPKLESVFILTLVDMTGSNGLEYLQKEISLEIIPISLIKGKYIFESNGTTDESNVKSIGNGLSKKEILPKIGGRTGVFASQWDINKLPCNKLISGSVLVVGTGEFMYEPYRLALDLENKGYEVYFQATTRSPILLGADIKYKHNFLDNYGESIDNFLYNVDKDQYDNIFICYETKSLPETHDLPKTLKANCCYLVH